MDVKSCSPLPYSLCATRSEKLLRSFLALAAITIFVIGILGILGNYHVLETSLRSIGNTGLGCMMAAGALILIALYRSRGRTGVEKYFKPQKYELGFETTKACPQGAVRFNCASSLEQMIAESRGPSTRPRTHYENYQWGDSYQKLVTVANRMRISDPIQRLKENFGENYPEVTLIDTTINNTPTGVYEKSIEFLFLREQEFLNLPLAELTNQVNLAYYPLINVLCMRFHGASHATTHDTPCLGNIPTYKADFIAQNMGTGFPLQALFCLNDRQIRDLLSHPNMPRVLAENLFSDCNHLMGHYAAQHAIRMYNLLSSDEKAKINPYLSTYSRQLLNESES